METIHPSRFPHYCKSSRIGSITVANIPGYGVGNAGVIQGMENPSIIIIVNCVQTLLRSGTRSRNLIGKKRTNVSIVPRFYEEEVR
jgi:hypothetical protein